jgi:glycosyltransferase involved in cell wall biosynthesis
VKILFTSAIPYLPQIYGGLNTNTHELALELIQRGHHVSVLTRISYRNAFGARAALTMQLMNKRCVCDATYGYPVYRAREPWTVIDDLPRPDVAIMQDGQMLLFAKAFTDHHIPTVGYFHGLDFEDWTIDNRPAATSDLPSIEYVANSQFTARRFRNRYALSAEVIPPVFRPERYRVERDGRNVTFVNPVAEKGVDIALKLAEACPEIPFAFVKGWPLSVRDNLRLRARVRRLKNVELSERLDDMRIVYRKCRILIVPSRWGRETWGRVASEAQVSGIPVIGSDHGGLPEAVGPGGIVIDLNEPIDTWVKVLKKLWHDVTYYNKMSRAALSHSIRPQIKIDVQVSALEMRLERAINGNVAARAVHA